MTTQSKAAVLTDLIEAFCAHDLDRVRALVDDRIVHQETGTGRRLDGVDAYMGMCESWLTAFPDVAGKITAGLDGANQAVIEIRWTGTNNGPIALPDGQIPATGKSIDLGSTYWATFAGDKIVESRHHLDVFGMLQQLGLAG